jgi:hypothetical protein
MKALSGLKEDCSKEQSKSLILNDWCSNHQDVVCADLSAATDRFPRLFQVELLNQFSAGLGNV